MECKNNWVVLQLAESRQPKMESSRRESVELEVGAIHFHPGINVVESGASSKLASYD